MRHLLGLLLAVLVAAALFFAVTWGFTQLAEMHGSGLTGPRGLAAIGALVGTGLLLGLVMCVPWISPLAAGLPGLVLLGWTGLLIARSQAALRYVPLSGDLYGSGFHMLLVDGALAVAGMAMIVPLFVPSRWVRHAGVDDDLEDGMVPVSEDQHATGLLS